MIAAPRSSFENQTRKQRHILILLISRLLTGCYCLPLVNLGTTTKQSLGIGNKAFLCLYNSHKENMTYMKTCTS